MKKGKTKKHKMKKGIKKENVFILSEMLSLISLSSVFISASFLVEDLLQTLFISVGTGLLSSAIVSFAFWRIQRDIEIRNATKKRAVFMEQAKILFYNILDDINWAPIKNTTITLCEYIKAQHRWFHEYYKRMVADNDVDCERIKRIQQISDFNNIYMPKLNAIFNSRVNWEEGNFTDRQLSELRSVYNEFCECANYIAQKNYEQAFYSIAWFLEILKRIMCEDGFNEFCNFSLLKFKYNEDGKLLRIDDDFDEKESLIQFAKRFNTIRYSNYKKLYGKSVDEEEHNGQVDINV